MSFVCGRDHSKKFKPEDMQLQIQGKNCVVTGANSGIGYAAAEGLASRGATVYMVCRNKERGQEALSKIQNSTGNQNVYLEVCDLSSFNDIKSFASSFASKDVPVHVLVNNAGFLENKHTTTPEGFELNFAGNVLGTYTMTELRLPLLEKASPDAKVITVSSGGMYTSPLTTDLQVTNLTFMTPFVCVTSLALFASLNSRCCVWFFYSDKYKNKGIDSYLMHPGWAETPGVARSLPSFKESFSGKLRTSEEGADTVVWLALQPKEKLVSGAFYFDRAEAPKHLTLADHYALLGLGSLRYLATEDQIRKSYREAALKLHPDKLSAALLLSDESDVAKQAKREAIESHFKLIQEAYGLLMDPNKRRIFDFTDEFDDAVPSDCAPKDFFKV
ncbi:unnamed protein product [Eruca vesicaria subsp. sativa]|uniref:J domain-containing protein n=1 Tax=Eruca vesicaria subsp. sativa TaxID=29727 RepID=A0ABC8LLK9_ERUVS|nr:unnamed protein product [Eruca vesicaria subsp. sativa]